VSFVITLGLIIPEPVGSSRIRVGKDVRFWEEGKSMIFDDSHLHEVWNDCDSQRIVLFVDVERPAAFPAFDTQSSDHLDHSPITECRRTEWTESGSMPATPRSRRSPEIKGSRLKAIFIANGAKCRAGLRTCSPRLDVSSISLWGEIPYGSTGKVSR